MTSIGRVLLGGLSPEEFAHYAEAAELKPLTRKTVTSLARLRRVVEDGRSTGWVYVGGELEDEICGIAVPLVDSSRRIIAAMNVSLSVSSSAERHAIKTMLPHLQSAATKIVQRCVTNNRSAEHVREIQRTGADHRQVRPRR